MLNMSLLVCRAIDENRKVHIVYMGSLPANHSYSPLSHHLNMLERVVKNGSNLLTRSYKRSFNGFAAKLTDNERHVLANMKEVELDSFKDDGFGPAPKKWKGACAGGRNLTCNNKIIGARFYQPIQSARDEEGHGTHTASTAAGNAVKDVSFYRLAQGSEQQEETVVLELVLLQAWHHGCSQWQAAASSTDRRIIDTVVLGNGTTIVGLSVNSFTLNGTSFPLIYGKAASMKCSELGAGQCHSGCLDSDFVKGKIVLCDDYFEGDVAYQAKAVGSF
ncbi:putative cucumisin [Rosa chinensis]|uniref:Putative cucumisin n=1 Tax=Rosa chinensis TaxID=74649 RepID=A0A2P6S9J3_ROSCH|nr:putative cucumisin [Rosa chinensis]